MAQPLCFLNSISFLPTVIEIFTTALISSSAPLTYSSKPLLQPQFLFLRRILTIFSQWELINDLYKLLPSLAALFLKQSSSLSQVTGFANCCPLLTLFMHFPIWSLFSFNLSLSSFSFLTNLHACLSLSFIQNIPVFTQPVLLRGSHPWMHGACCSHFHLIPPLYSQWELLKPVCSNFLQSNLWVLHLCPCESTSCFNSNNHTAMLSSFGFHSTALSSMCSLVNLPSHISSCGGYREAKDYLTQLK